TAAVSVAGRGRSGQVAQGDADLWRMSQSFGIQMELVGSGSDLLEAPRQRRSRNAMGGDVHRTAMRRRFISQTSLQRLRLLDQHNRDIVFDRKKQMTGVADEPVLPIGKTQITFALG